MYCRHGSICWFHAYIMCVPGLCHDERDCDVTCIRYGKLVVENDKNSRRVFTAIMIISVRVRVPSFR